MNFNKIKSKYLPFSLYFVEILVHHHYHNLIATPFLIHYMVFSILPNEKESMICFSSALPTCQVLNAKVVNSLSLSLWILIKTISCLWQHVSEEISKNIIGIHIYTSKYMYTNTDIFFGLSKNGQLSHQK